MYTNYILLFLTMLFCHIVDDYYLQGWLASAKSKKWWESNSPNPLFKNDYIMALIEHAFSWTFMVHLPIIIYSIVLNKPITSCVFIITFIINWLIHIITDNAKANLLKINLIQDQIIHIIQIIITCFTYSLLIFK